MFVAIGRRNHNEGTALFGILSVSAPFLIALGASWIGLRTWREPFNRAALIATWVITVFVGLLLRRLVFDRGIATSFIIVATITLGVLLGLGRLLSRKLSAKTSQSCW
jgi:ABC-type sugar transport system permease subunit